MTCNGALFPNEERKSPLEYYRHSSEHHEHHLRDLGFLLSSLLTMLIHTAFPDFRLVDDTNAFSGFGMTCDAFVWLKHM